MNGPWKKFSLLAISVSLLALFQNCSLVSSAQKSSSSSATSASAAPSTDQKAMGILATKCMSCHNSTTPQGDLDVADLNSMLFYRHIVPGEPLLSNIFYEISQGQMPPAPGTPLTDDEVAIISDWITNGFKDGVPSITPPAATVIPPTYTSIKAAILTNTCNGCHSGANPRAGVALDSYQAVMMTVTAGNSTTSRLYKAITGNGATLMPPNGGLSAAQKTAIKTWIDTGAMNN